MTSLQVTDRATSPSPPPRSRSPSPPARCSDHLRPVQTSQCLLVHQHTQRSPSLAGSHRGISHSQPLVLMGLTGTSLFCGLCALVSSGCHRPAPHTSVRGAGHMRTLTNLYRWVKASSILLRGADVRPGLGGANSHSQHCLLMARAQPAHGSTRCPVQPLHKDGCWGKGGSRRQRA